MFDSTIEKIISDCFRRCHHPFAFFELESNVIIPGGFLETGNKGDTLYQFGLTAEINF